MLYVELHKGHAPPRHLQVPDDTVIGKSDRADIRLDGWRIAQEHARLLATPSGVLLEDMGTLLGVSVNGRRVESHYGPLKSSDVVTIGAYRLRVTQTIQEAVKVKPESARVDLKPETQTVNKPSESSKTRPASTGLSSVPDGLKEARLTYEWRRRIHAELLHTMDLQRSDITNLTDDQLRAKTRKTLQDLISLRQDELPACIPPDELLMQVLNEAVGLGPLEELLNDESVSEIMVNRYDEIYVEQGGRLRRHPTSFTSDRAVLGVIERIVGPIGRRIDEASPMVDARLKDGSRVNAIIPPLALKGPCLTIRKFSKQRLQARDLVAVGSLSPDMATFLKICVEARKNIIVSGGTGSGKTTLLNILSNFIPSAERLITVEDAAELQLHHEHLVSLESRPGNLEGKGSVPIRDLVRNTLRMRPDRIVIGECRGSEALDMLQAMNTGHEGSLTTLHANSPRDALVRLETMVMMAGIELPLQAIREQIQSAVDIIVQQVRFACGSRIVTSIAEVTGIESGKIQLQELFRFQPKGTGSDQGKVQGSFTACDMVPSFYEDLRSAGKPMDMSLFRISETDHSDRPEPQRRLKGQDSWRS